MRFLRPLCLAGLTLALAMSAGCSKSASYYMAHGKDLYAKKDYKGAIVDFRNAIAREPRLGEGHRQLADAYLAIGDLRDGIKEYIRAADVRPDDVALQIKAGQYLLLAGQSQDAKARADAVLQKDPA
ncbi:MAG: tetratricopeptide repeat protein, partial [Vicinamibacterales bacterium]